MIVYLFITGLVGYLCYMSGYDDAMSDVETDKENNNNVN